MHDANIKFGIDQLIASYYVRYNKLTQLVNSFYRNSNSNKLSIFIDLNSVLKRLYADTNISLNSSSPIDISSAIINMCGHYRKFFSYIGVGTRFFLIYGNNAPAYNINVMPNYNSLFLKDTCIKTNVTDIINKSLQLVSMITEYIPEVYFLDCNDAEVTSMMVKVIETLDMKSDPTQEILVISKDVLALQLVPKYKNLKILRPYKYNNEDNSYMVNQRNLWEMFLMKYRKVTSMKNVSDIGIEFISNVLAMSRLPERCLKSHLDIKTAMKGISICLESDLLKPNTLYMQSSINTAMETIKDRISYHKEEVNCKWTCINPFYQYKYILPISYPMDIILKNINDPDSLKNIVNTDYDKAPIFLDSLQ